MPDSSAFDVELAIEMLKRHKYIDINHTPTELFKAVNRTI
jgi:hypothetical protein